VRHSAGSILTKHPFSLDLIIIFKWGHYCRSQDWDHLIDWEAGVPRGLALWPSGRCRVRGERVGNFWLGRSPTALLYRILLNESPLPRVSTFKFSPNVNLLTILLDNEHRDEDGNLVLLEMWHLKCESKFRIFEPLPQYRMPVDFSCVPWPTSHPAFSKNTAWHPRWIIWSHDLYGSRFAWFNSSTISTTSY
jgi:hypothetical protein